MKIDKGFAERLRELRKQKGLSQSELGERVGIHYIHLGRYERGQAKPSAESLQKLADALETTTDYLLDGATDALAIGRLSDEQLLRQFQQVEKLPDNDKAIVKELIDAFLFKRRITAEVAGRAA